MTIQNELHVVYSRQSRMRQQKQQQQKSATLTEPKGGHRIEKTQYMKKVDK